jgi:ribosomal protein S18 acetylase RimI-like enzyme
VSGNVSIEVLDARGVEQAADELANVLLDCIAGGASVSFMADFSHREAFAFFWQTAVAVEDRQTALLVARVDGKVVGTVQLGLDTPPNQPHRADVKKLLVHRSARGKGIGEALMLRLEDEARKHQRTLLVLDTVPDMAGERLYVRQGWTRVGVIPGYALFPDGTPCDTAIFWKRV